MTPHLQTGSIMTCSERPVGGRLRWTARRAVALAVTVLAALAAALLSVAGPAAPASAATFPSDSGKVTVSSTTTVSGTFDGGMKQFSGIGDGSQSESQDAMFLVKNGGTIKNVIIGPPAGDGIHCEGSCTIQNVWWLDVGEDAATFKGTSSSTKVVVSGGGARKASDKVFQHNGGGSVSISNFQVEDFGKLYRSCGNCSKQFKRSVSLTDVTVTAPGKSIVGINTDQGDTATFSKITILGDPQKKISICDRFTSAPKGKEPTKTGSGADGTFCRFATSDLTYR